jgi:hypothetical protein
MINCLTKEFVRKKNFLSNNKKKNKNLIIIYSLKFIQLLRHIQRFNLNFMIDLSHIFKKFLTIKEVIPKHVLKKLFSDMILKND